MNYQPHQNDGKHVFVFGSNLAGRNGKGAALTAARHWGAIYGVGVGRTGNAYAIPTKSASLGTLSLVYIGGHVRDFIEYAKAHPELTFLVTAIGCGLAGYSPHQIAPMFKEAPKNCVLPEEFKL
jgi:hypothetical protein